GAGAVGAEASWPTLGGAKVTGVSASGGRSLALGLSDGRVIPVEIGFHASGSGEARRVEGDVRLLEPMRVDPAGRPIRVLAHSAREGGSGTAAAVEGKQIVVERGTEETSLVGGKTRQEYRNRAEAL